MSNELVVNDEDSQTRNTPDIFKSLVRSWLLFWSFGECWNPTPIYLSLVHTSRARSSGSVDYFASLPSSEQSVQSSRISERFYSCSTSTSQASLSISSCTADWTTSTARASIRMDSVLECHSTIRRRVVDHSVSKRISQTEVEWQ